MNLPECGYEFLPFAAFNGRVSLRQSEGTSIAFCDNHLILYVVETHVDLLESTW